MIDIWRRWWDENSWSSDAHERPISSVVDQCEKNISHNPEALESRGGGDGGGWLDRGRRKNQLVESFTKKGVGVVEVGLGLGWGRGLSELGE